MAVQFWVSSFFASLTTPSPYKGEHMILKQDNIFRKYLYYSRKSDFLTNRIDYALMRFSMGISSALAIFAIVMALAARPIIMFEMD